MAPGTDVVTGRRPAQYHELTQVTTGWTAETPA
jgi:hypothetical protein